MSTNGKPRLLCRVIRLRNAMTDSRPSNHVAHCADCQAYYRASDTLVSRLQNSAPRPSQAVPEDLALRISRTIRQNAPQPRRNRAPLWWSSFAGATAVAAIALLVVRQNPTAPTISHNQQDIPALQATDVTRLVENVDSLRTRLLTSVGPSAAKLAADNPLTQELTSVQADARSALNFLTLNFLPSDSAARLRSQSEPAHS